MTPTNKGCLIYFFEKSSHFILLIPWKNNLSIGNNIQALKKSEWEKKTPQQGLHRAIPDGRANHHGVPGSGLPVPANGAVQHHVRGPYLLLRKALRAAHTPVGAFQRTRIRKMPVHGPAGQTAVETDTAKEPAVHSKADGEF